MHIIIQQETEQDHTTVFKLIEEAFKKEKYSDKKEQFLVERLRKSEAFIPDLSLLAKYQDEIIGYILLTKIKIRNEEQTFESLALAPVCVAPKFQGKRIGEKLIQKAHSIAKELGYESVVLLGHQDYYPRFGYKPAHTFRIKLPFDVPKENVMAIELKENALQNVSGIVEYPKAFGI
ncbi:GNAT family N-acetyltransferase [Bernardetia sp.]|uniref:GNAT family N-acetyltransferase n=1 Tax=Bernardetia sp. TaxID=1937974 RepID=UPI0025C64167|nr:N-acetyltransferase [Bernardetia sp.]